MQTEHPMHWDRPFGAAVVAAAAFAAGGAIATAAGPHLVSQAGRMFQPIEIAIKRGEIVELLNDDGDLLHHAYIDSDRMNFNSGDLKPGARTRITFPILGDFNVLCAIHPKMKLLVRVK